MVPRSREGRCGPRSLWSLYGPQDPQPKRPQGKRTCEQVLAPEPILPSRLWQGAPRHPAGRGSRLSTSPRTPRTPKLRVLIATTGPLYGPVPAQSDMLARLCPVTLGRALYERLRGRGSTMSNFPYERPNTHPHEHGLESTLNSPKTVLASQGSRKEGYGYPKPTASWNALGSPTGQTQYSWRRRLR